MFRFERRLRRRNLFGGRLRKGGGAPPSYLGAGGQDQRDAAAVLAASVAIGGADDNAPAVHLGHLMGEGEAESEAIGGPLGRARLVEAVEGREDALALLGRNAGAFVGNREHHV